jgi:hypothetical protein
MVKAKPRHDGREPGGEVIDRCRARESKPGFLKYVVCIGFRPKYPDGDCSQPGPLGVKIWQFHGVHTLLTHGNSRM